VENQDARSRRDEQLRSLLVASEDFYAITDLRAAKRIGSVLWLVGAVIIVALFPVAEPTRHVGDAGWAVAGTIVMLSLAGAWRLRRAPDRVSPGELILQAYLWILAIGLLVWMGGDPYSELLMIAALYVGAVHPPRRVVPFLVALGAVACAPLAYDSWSSTHAASIATRLLLWFGLAAAAMFYTAMVRSNRLALSRRRDEARLQARLDPLTGLGNRRAFDEAVQRALPGARRSDRPFSVVIADLEDFKAINDRFGHIEGDRCLREIADAFRSAVRAPDACFRWGGDEFAIVLPTTNYEAAKIVGSRVRETVRRDIALADGEPVRLRFGAAELDHDMDADGLLAAADLALMSARLAREGEHGRPAPPADAEDAG
jgi:diguanylate cyclase (GGDEF)-like protein